MCKGCGRYSTEKKGYPAIPKTLGEEIRKRRLDLNLRQIDVAIVPPPLFGVCKSPV
jgi:hypothetical protein